MDESIIPPVPPTPKKAGAPVRKPDDPDAIKARLYMQKYRARLKQKGLKATLKPVGGYPTDYIRDRARVKLVVEYTPFNEQKLFGKALDDGKKIVLFVGGIRGGKTYAGARELLKCVYKRLRLKDGKKSGMSWIVSPTFPMSQIVEAEFERACDLGGGKSLILRKYIGQRAYLLYPPPGYDKPYRVEIKSAEHPDRLRGSSLDYIWVDEASMMDKDVYTILLGRILDSKGTVFMTTTPKGMNWLYSEIFQKQDKDPRIQVIKSVTSNNPHLDPLDIEHLRNQYSVNFAKQELGAEFVNFQGLVYPSFDHERHITQPIDKDLPKDAVVVCGLDAGYKDPLVCLWIMKWRDRYYVLDEYYAGMRTMETHSSALKGHYLNSIVARRWMDPSAAQESADLAGLHVQTFPAKNDIRAGINSVARLIETDRLFIAKNCVNTLNEISQYQYKDDSGRNSGEVPVDKFNHAMDALRYAIYSEDGYNQEHPFIVTKEDGSYQLIGGKQPDPMSNSLDDWTKLHGYNPIGEIGEGGD